MEIPAYIGKENQKVYRMNILLVDDHAILLDGLETLVQSSGDYSVIGKATSMAGAMKELENCEPDLLITDYNLPDGDGLTLFRKAKRIYPHLKVLVLSMHDEAHLVKEILKEGVNGYMLKRDPHKELITALDAIAEGKVYLSNEINSMLIRSIDRKDERSLLTEREREVLNLIAQENTNKQIAETLFISERTVETHRKNIFRKTQTSSLVGLIKFAYANNLI